MTFPAPPGAAVLAHAGPGSTWQAMVVVAGIVLAGFLLAAAAGWLRMEEADDLTVPFAVAAIVSGLGTVVAGSLSDSVGWGLPLAVVCALTLLVAALTRLDVRFPSPLPMGAVALSIVAGVTLHQPLTVALHPPVELLPLSDDSTVMVVEPADGSVVEDTPVTVVVEVTGASLGPGIVAVEELGDDPEEGATLAVAIEEVGDEEGSPQRRIEVEQHETCTLEAPCERISFDVDEPPGTYELTAELVRGDGTPLAPFVRDRISFTIP